MNRESLMSVYHRANLSFEKGKGIYLYGTDGKKYLDFAAGIAVNALGHCHPAVNKALIEQAKKLWHVSNLYKIPEAEAYAQKLVSSTNFASKVFFCNSGAESIECGIKIMRRYFYLRGQNRYKIITFSGSFHGRTIATISAAGNPKYLEGFEPKLDGFTQVNIHHGEDDVRHTLAQVKNAIDENTAGILIEPIQGEGGIRFKGKEFLKSLRNIADESNILLMFDEVQCGMGRTGHLFAADTYHVKPDILATAKGIGNGFPLGACLTNKETSDVLTTSTHGNTFGSNPLAMSVATSVLDTIMSNGFLDSVKENAKFLHRELDKLHKKHQSVIEEIRGVGLILGIKFKDKFDSKAIVENLRNNLLLTAGAGENVVRIIPPLIVNKENIKKAISIMDKTFLEL